MATEFRKLSIRATAEAEVSIKGSSTPGKPTRAVVKEFVDAYSAAFIVGFGQVCLSITLLPSLGSALPGCAQRRVT